jgi:hypothetical protein
MGPRRWSPNKHSVRVTPQPTGVSPTFGNLVWVYWLPARVELECQVPRTYFLFSAVAFSPTVR